MFSSEAAPRIIIFSTVAGGRDFDQRSGTPKVLEIRCKGLATAGHCNSTSKLLVLAEAVHSSNGHAKQTT